MIKQQFGDGPIEPKYVKMMEEAAWAIDKFFNGDLCGEERKTGFVLLVFGFNENGERCNYISNSNRVDVVKLLREQANRLDTNTQ